MKILWVTNLITGDLGISKGYKATSGQWLNAEIEKEKNLKENELVVVTSDVNGEEYFCENIKYILLPHGNVSRYAVNDEHIEDWKKLFQKEKPDKIVIWGTEYNIGRCALIANEKKIPSLIYIQGVMRSIAENYRGGFSNKEIKGFTTLVEKIRKTSVFDTELRQRQKAEEEKESVLLCDAVIVENDWAASEYKAISEDIKIYRSRLPIKTEFAEFCWTEEAFEKYSIVTTAANYPLKGLHKLLEALKRVKEDYPEVKLYIPGPNNVYTKGFKAKLLQNGYNRYIKAYIKKNNLFNNVIFTGPLVSSEYALLMQKANVFVTASAIENHCSALREAMSVGVPCVSSRVGGIPEYAIDKENCALYDFADTQKLAENIIELFEDGDLRAKYSNNGKATIFKMYNEDVLMSLTEIYSELA